MSEMDDKLLSDIEARVKAASPKPWTQDSNYVVAEIEHGRPGGEVIIICNPTVHNPPGYQLPQRVANARFVTHARQDIPDLCAEVHRLRAENEAMRAVVDLARHDTDPERYPQLWTALSRLRGGK